MDNLNLYFGFTLLGVIIGLGAAVIILLLGIRSLFSHKWFNILNGTDQLTIKFMVWPGAMSIGIGLLIGGNDPRLSISIALKAIILAVLLTNGSYLTFIFAPVIRKLENDGVSTFLKLPMPHQVLIFISGTITAICWTSHAIILWLEIIHLIK